MAIIFGLRAGMLHMPEISERIHKKLITMVVPREANWALGRRREEEDLLFTLL